MLVVAVGAYLIGGATPELRPYLLGFYAFGLAGSIGYLLALRRRIVVTQGVAWALLLVDFCFVAATVSFTDGPRSLFTFVFVVVILEAGLILGIRQAFAIAAFATLTMLMFVLWPWEPVLDRTSLVLWYNFVVQALAFFLTASVSSFWNLRVRRLQDFQREILDDMTNGFIITNGKGIIIAQNKAADRILETAAGTTIGNSVELVLSTESQAECPVLTALRSSRDFTSYEFTCVLPGSAKRKLLGLTTSRVVGEAGEIEILIASFSDLTEMARMRNELQRQDRMAVVGELAAGLAHEIRNPVASIRGAVDELNTSLSTPSLAEKLMVIALRECDHLNSIVTGFLEFATNPTMRREILDLVALVQDVVDSKRDGLSDGHTIAFEHGERHCWIAGDPMRLRQVVLNIVTNAIEAMTNGGALTIHLGSSTGFVELRFDDEGDGIDPDKVDKIFEPFYTTRDTGVGMGLAICHRIVTAHDGTIHAMSRPGGGASIVVKLPAARVEE